MTTLENTQGYALAKLTGLSFDLFKVGNEDELRSAAASRYAALQRDFAFATDTTRRGVTSDVAAHNRAVYRTMFAGLDVILGRPVAADSLDTASIMRPATTQALIQQAGIGFADAATTPPSSSPAPGRALLLLGAGVLAFLLLRRS